MSGTPQGPDPRIRHGVGALIFVLTVVVYAPVRHHDWLNYDDNVYVTESAPVRSGWSAENVVWAFSSFDGANWFPLTRLSWMLDAEIHGLDAGRFLLTNVLLHALASLALFAALVRLCGSIWPSAFTAAVFALHPLHVESVAWIAARKDPLSGLFWMLALWIYAGRVGQPASGAKRAGVFACAALGLMAKPTVVTLPFVLLLLDVWPGRRLRRSEPPSGWDRTAVREAVVEKLPLFALVAAASAVTVLAQSSGGTIADLDQVSVIERVANALVSTAKYISMACWPADLAIFYPHAGSDVPVGGALLAAAALLAASIVAWASWDRRPFLPVGWFWYLGTLVPVIGLVQVGSQGMADRYMYLPLVGLCIAVAWGAAGAVEDSPRRRAAVALVGCAVVASLAWATTVQLRSWRDSASLFRHALAVTRDNHVAHAYLGAALLADGRTGEAIGQYQESLALRPDQLTVVNNLAWLLATGSDARHRDPLLAVELAERAARLSDGSDPAILDTLAAAYASAGRFADAVRTARRAVRLGREGGDAVLSAAIEKRLALYHSRSAFVEGR